MISPRAAANPQASALPFPRRFWSTMRTSGRSMRATPIVSSVECPSTTITSWRPRGRRANTCGRLAASLIVGMTTLTRSGGVWVRPFSPMRAPPCSRGAAAVRAPDKRVTPVRYWSFEPVPRRSPPRRHASIAAGGRRQNIHLSQIAAGSHCRLSNSCTRATVQSFSRAHAVSRRDGMSTDPTHDRMPMEPRTTTPESPSYAAASPRGELAGSSAVDERDRRRDRAVVTRPSSSLWVWPSERRAPRCAVPGPDVPSAISVRK